MAWLGEAVKEPGVQAAQVRSVVVVPRVETTVPATHVVNGVQAGTLVPVEKLSAHVAQTRFTVGEPSLTMN